MSCFKRFMNKKYNAIWTSAVSSINLVRKGKRRMASQVRNDIIFPLPFLWSETQQQRPCACKGTHTVAQHCYLKKSSLQIASSITTLTFILRTCIFCFSICSLTHPMPLIWTTMIRFLMSLLKDCEDLKEIITQLQVITVRTKFTREAVAWYTNHTPITTWNNELWEKKTTHQNSIESNYISY